MAKISVSILSADFDNLNPTLALLEEHGAGYLHLDVMDGVFVPNETFGPELVKSLEGTTGLPFDIHLMISNPAEFVSGYVTKNTEYIVVHEEVAEDLEGLLSQIRALGVKCGVAIKPNTAPETINSVIGKVDQILVMSVEPGFGGQKFIDTSLDKVRYFAEERTRHSYDFKIAIDGGIGEGNIAKIRDAGADIIICGTSILGAPDPAAVLDRLNDIVE
ncbi:MAG: ribulose-phosphate 3-epimerase [Clostridiales Family XIII bacterium]|jgi:ribulose-phosphate 3-epimerase|nr:ribulose-phosphate 3-epimerase [Clostridiales Family XIII bacterium]